MGGTRSCVLAHSGAPPNVRPTLDHQTDLCLGLDEAGPLRSRFRRENRPRLAPGRVRGDGDGGSTMASKAEQIIAGLGGVDNIIEIEPCITRLRAEVEDASLVDEAKLKTAGAMGLVRMG